MKGMDDRKKVIYSLERCICHVPDACRDCAYYERFLNSSGCECEEMLMKDALELLKAQEPVKPLVTGNGHTFAEAETWWYECGNCNDPIDPNDQYCRHCGRAVKWDE